MHFILSHSIFISFCAVALCYQSYVLLSLESDCLVYLLVFSCTLCSYNAYWLLSKHKFNKVLPFHKFITSNFSNVLLFVLSLVGMIVCLFYIPGIFTFLVIAGILTLLYTLPLWPPSIIKVSINAGLLKTVLLALTWTYVTIVLPAQPRLAELNATFVLLFATRFLFMLMLCAIFDSRDSDLDKVRGLKSLATDVSKPVLKIIMLSTFALYITLGIVLRYHLHSVSQTIAFILTGVLVLLVYFFSLKTRGYIFYYFIVDGLMLFSAIATFVAAIG